MNRRAPRAAVRRVIDVGIRIARTMADTHRAILIEHDVVQVLPPRGQTGR